MRLPSSGRIAFVCSIVGISLCHKASAEDPAARARSLLGRGRARMKAGDPGAAVSLLTQAKAAAPNDPEILMELGLAELRESNGERCRGEGCGWRDEARKDTTAAIAAARTPAERAAAEFNLGLIEEEPDAAAALEAFDRSIALRPSDAASRHRSAAARRLAADEKLPLAAFRAFAVDWARTHDGTIVDWWTAPLEEGEGIDRVALVCHALAVPGDAPKEPHGVYLIESTSGARQAVAFPASHVRVCDAERPRLTNEPRFRHASERAIAHDYHDDANDDRPIDLGTDVLVRFGLRHGQAVLLEAHLTERCGKRCEDTHSDYDWQRACAAGTQSAIHPTAFTLEYAPGEPCFPSVRSLSPDLTTPALH